MPRKPLRTVRTHRSVDVSLSLVSGGYGRDLPDAFKPPREGPKIGEGLDEPNKWTESDFRRVLRNREAEFKDTYDTWKAAEEDMWMPGAQEQRDDASADMLRARGRVIDWETEMEKNGIDPSDNTRAPEPAPKPDGTEPIEPLPDDDSVYVASADESSASESA